MSNHSSRSVVNDLLSVYATAVDDKFLGLVIISSADIVSANLQVAQYDALFILACLDRFARLPPVFLNPLSLRRRRQLSIGIQLLVSCLLCVIWMKNQSSRGR